VPLLNYASRRDVIWARTAIPRYPFDTRRKLDGRTGLEVGRKENILRLPRIEPYSLSSSHNLITTVRS